MNHNMTLIQNLQSLYNLFFIMQGMQIASEWVFSVKVSKCSSCICILLRQTEQSRNSLGILVPGKIVKTRYLM